MKQNDRYVKVQKLGFFFILLVSLCFVASALADDAQDITQECIFKTSYTHQSTSKMTDGKYTTAWTSEKSNQPYVIVTMPAGLLCYGVYICFAEMPDDWMVQTVSGGKWTDVAVPDEGYYHIFVSLCGVDEMRIIAKYDKSYQKLSINEIYFFSYGDVPAWVQRWEPTPTDADIMFLVAHPDDELLFMGGAIPTYATEQQRKVVVAYMTHSNATRRSELLNGLWKMGVHTYPVIGNFWDTYTTTLSESEKKWDKNKALLYVIELYRKYKPKVVVTHDFNGEYGHGMHKLTAELAELAYNQAADPEQDTESAEQYGVWQVKKLYSHLYEHNQIVFDWDVPLQSMDGKTSLELATEAYKLHITQQSTKLTMETTGVKYDNRVFGLVCSIVGEDVRHDDFLENILDSVTYVAAVTTPSVTPAPTPVASYTALMPKLNEDGFIDEGEFVYEDDDDNGIWIYVSQTLKVVIQRQFDPDTPLRWYEAEIWSDISAGEIFQTIYYDPEKKEKVRVDASETALKYGIVFAMNTDYYTYRLNSVRRKGIVIRDGEILLNDPYTSYTKAFPNLDTLALFPDGDMKVYTSNELTAQEYLDEGATDVLSFGPYLLRDRELNPETYVVSTTTNPRCAIGMVEPGHYAAILAEGRLSDSGGITVAYLGKLMRAMGCEVAFNLDGGQTAVMLFMGKQLNQIGAYDEKTNARATCEVIGIGSSSLVPSEKTEKD